jgi:hypothetical protein
MDRPDRREILEHCAGHEKTNLRPLDGGHWKDAIVRSYMEELHETDLPVVAEALQSFVETCES